MYEDKFAFQNRLGQPYSWKKNLPFLLCFTSYLRALFQVQATGGGLYLEGRFNGGFLRYRFGGLYLEGLIFGILRYSVVEIFLLPHPAGGSYMQMPCHFITIF